jgi:putative DNA methylase
MKMTSTYKKKLIEVAIPLEAINAASAREKSIRHGHPSTLHLWWARRPLAACRAVLFAQLVDDPSGYAAKLLDDPKIRKQAEVDLPFRLAVWESRKEDAKGILSNTPRPSLEDCAVEIERKRLFQIIEDLVKWENSTNQEVLERARVEIRRSCGDELPPVYDPFSGGGSIPLEAQRLGLPAYGSDLNPVAVMIGKAMIEIPPKFKDQPPIHPGGKERNHYRNAEGLAEDVKYFGEWMRERAFERIGHLYPQVDLPTEYGNGKATVIAWIWARTVPSPDPAFSGVQVPLVSSFLLSSKRGKEAWIEPIIDKVEKTIGFEIRVSGTTAEIENAEQGTKVGRAHFRCLLSDAAIDATYVRQAAQRGALGARLIALVVKGARGRVYLPPTDDHETLANQATPHWKPEGRVPTPSHDVDRLPMYGMPTWGDAFSKRQLLVLTSLSELVHEARIKVEGDAELAGASCDGAPLCENGNGARAYAEAVSVYLAFLVGQMANHCSTVCGWNSPNQQMRSTFSRQAIPMTWDYAEVNPFSSSSGSYNNLFERLIKGFEVLGSVDGVASVTQSDAQNLAYPAHVVISTDPPYYDNISYSDVSDFFFAWMKPTLKSVFPDLFGMLATPKAEELVASLDRHGGRDAAEKFFLEGMTAAMTSMTQSCNTLYPATIYYAFKQREIEQEGVSSSGWATFIQAVLDAGFAVVGTWPVRTEKPGRMVAVGTNALANSVVLVCRKKEAAAEVITRAEFIRALKRELPSAIAELQAANIAPADMPQSAIGPGMGVFSRYKAVLESDDSPMSVKTALQLINRELDEYLGGIQGEFDADTRFAITWFEQFGTGKGEFGTANSIAQARGISVDSVKHAGIVESSAGKVRILKRDELLEDWEPETDAHLTIWECCQHLVRTLENDGEYAAAVLLKKMGSEKAEAVKDLAYCLFDISSNKRKDAKEATSFNALIAVWTDLTRLAATVHDVRGDGQMRMEL